MAFASHTQSSVAVAYAAVVVAVAAALGFGLLSVIVQQLLAVASYSYPFAFASSGAPVSCFHVALLDFHSHFDCAFAWGLSQDNRTRWSIAYALGSWGFQPWFLLLLPWCNG